MNELNGFKPLQYFYLLDNNAEASEVFLAIWLTAHTKWTGPKKSTHLVKQYLNTDVLKEVYLNTDVLKEFKFSFQPLRLFFLFCESPVNHCAVLSVS